MRKQEFVRPWLHSKEKHRQWLREIAGPAIAALLSERDALRADVAAMRTIVEAVANGYLLCLPNPPPGKPDATVEISLDIVRTAETLAAKLEAE